MKLCIRAHDLGVKGTQAILEQLRQLRIDGVQMVCYKAYEDIPYAPGGITEEKAGAIGAAFREQGAEISLIGAYFNPVHSDEAKRRRCFAVFAEYLACANAMGCPVVGSETGSFHDDKWTYHPSNRTEEALDRVVDTFSKLCDIAAEHDAVVAMEGAAGHVCWNVAALERARQKIAKPNLRVIFDLYNYLELANQEDYLKILDEGLETFGSRILLFHMKDCVFTPQGPRQVPLGTGQMDMEAILRKIKAHDPDAVLTLEGTAGADIPHAVKTIRDIWERV